MCDVEMSCVPAHVNVHVCVYTFALSGGEEEKNHHAHSRNLPVFSALSGLHVQVNSLSKQ